MRIRKCARVVSLIFFIWCIAALCYSFMMRRTSSLYLHVGAPDVAEKHLVVPDDASYDSSVTPNKQRINLQHSILKIDQIKFYNAVDTNEDRTLKFWKTEQQSYYCESNVIYVGSGFVMLKQAIVDNKHGVGLTGGEAIATVKNQNEESEYWQFKEGFFNIKCLDEPDRTTLTAIVPRFNSAKTHLHQYALATSLLTQVAFDKKVIQCDVVNNTVFAVTRYEYVNLYHSMTDFYNAYLNMIYFGLKPDNITILIVDGHPSGSLDIIWSTLFSNYIRVGHLKKPIYAKSLAWVLMSYDSPMHQHNNNLLPLHEEFRSFFLSRHGIPPESRSLNCKNISLLFIWRRDYIAHPRNMDGHVVRKIKNEKDLVSEIRAAFPFINIQGFPLESLNFMEQLLLISKTDILIGMHGAGLTHTLFLPSHGGLVELYPTYWSPGNIHFKSMARWRNLKYQRWVNNDPRNEHTNHYTFIPRGVVSALLRQVLHDMQCLTTDHD